MRFKEPNIIEKHLNPLNPLKPFSGNIYIYQEISILRKYIHIYVCVFAFCKTFKQHPARPTYAEAVKLNKNKNVRRFVFYLLNMYAIE